MWLSFYTRKELTSVRDEFLKMAWLKIRVFCDVTLSHWVSGYQISKNRIAFAFSSKQPKKDRLFTSCLWRRMHHDPSTGQETLTQWQCVKMLATSIRTSNAVHGEKACLPTSNTRWKRRVEQTPPAELPPRTWTATPPEPRQLRRRHRSSWGPSRSSPASFGRPFQLLKHKFEHLGSKLILFAFEVKWVKLQLLEELLKEECWTFVFYMSEKVQFWCQQVLCRWRLLQCRFWNTLLVVSLLYSRSLNSRNVRDVKTS